MQRREFIKATTLALTGAATSRIRRVKAQVQPRVVVVGGGFAGAACALDLRRLNPGIQVTLIDADERYVTCPMSNSVVVGWRDLDSITVSRRGLERAGVKFLHDRVTAIDPQRHSVHVASGATLAYERLVVAPGIRFLWNRPQGYDEAAAQIMPHVWQAGAQTQILAAQLRSMDAGGVVAISVPSGLMRCPPAPYERASLVAHYLSQHKPRSKILIFDSNNHFPRQDVFTAAWQSLYPGMIDWIAPTQDGAVVRVDAASMTLYTANAAHPVAVANVIAPQAPGQIAADAGLAAAHGWCPIAPASFESQLISNVHVIGDACIADAMPKSASAAASQAHQCARAIVALLAGREPAPPAFDSVCYSMLGPGRALAIHGRFSTEAGSIVALAAQPGPAGAGTDADAGASASAQQALAAQRWYRAIRADAFGD
jgi:sulfide dehydrogenase [flavocytochrome c] flavoprotein chain